MSRAPAAFPLSFQQRRLWSLHQATPGNPVLILGAALRHQGRPDVAALARALAEITRRHAPLRTGIRVTAAEPEQTVAPALPQSLPLVDLASLPPPRRESEARTVARLLSRPGFDLAGGRLVRFALLRLAGDAPWPGGAAAPPASVGDTPSQAFDLLLAWHRIAADGASLTVFAAELAAIYEAFAAGRPSPLSEPAVQYADYVLWQRTGLGEAALAAAVAYWRARLCGAPPRLDLPADRPRPARLTYRGAQRLSAVSPSLAAHLATLAASERTTLPTAFLACFSLLLHRHTGEHDLIIGTSAPGRDSSEAAHAGSLIGAFHDPLVLRATIPPGTGLRGLLRQLHEADLAALAHRHLPFAQLVSALRPPRDLSRTPIFQVLFDGRPAPPGGSLLPAGTLLGLPRELDLGAVSCDLVLAMAETAQGWHARWQYAIDLFDSATVQRMAGHFATLLAAALDRPDHPLGELAMLSSAERHQLLAGWNDTGAAFPAEPSLQDLISAQARRTPAAVAVEYDAQRLTYFELLSQAAELAGRLRRLGLAEETRIGIAAERSIEMVVGLLGTLLAGAAYVPLDPGYPADRLTAMVDDAGLAALLVQGRSLDRLGAAARPLAANGRVLALPPPGAAAAADDGAMTAASPGGGITSWAAAGSAAYVIFTSGSTGRPKGVAIPHRGIVNRLLWMQSAFPLRPDDRVLQKTPFTFDVSVWELFWPLLAGARLVVAPPGDHREPARLAQLVEEHQVTVMHFVPSMLQEFLAHPGLAASCRSLRRVFASGEALPGRLARRFLERLPAVELHNLYGPTEASVDVTFHPCRRGCAQPAVPIGRPVANTRILVLDANRELAAIGVAGELHIGGVGLARGYLRQPALTAERFVPDGYALEPGARLYRTGDLVRQRPDGAIEFLGRIDNQVKLRGLRVELGEIEAVLASHPAVRECVVLLREDEPGQPRLVAYVVANREPTDGGPEPILVPELRALARQRLPEPLLPAAFVLLESLPLSSSGKVDRKLLPAPQRGRSGTPYVAPRDAVETAMAGAWQQVLAGEPIGIHDNFFDHGGDSIMAIRIAMGLRAAGIVLEVRDFFARQTIAGLAGLLCERGAPARLEAPADDSAAGRFATVELEDEEIAELFGTAAR